MVSLWYLCLRLAEERQAAAEQCLQQPAAEDKRQKMLDSLSKAGVDNFTMKAAVPGTEVPGHKVWSSATSCFNQDVCACVTGSISVITDPVEPKPLIILP